jgi:hypothetical protein
MSLGGAPRLLNAKSLTGSVRLNAQHSPTLFLAAFALYERSIG